MNFLLNIIMAAVSLTVTAAIGLIILAVALLIWAASYSTQRGLEEMDKPEPTPFDETFNVTVVRITKQIRKATNEDECWAAQRAIGTFVTDYSDHPDVNREEAALRYILAERVGEVYVPVGV